jgi:hypothetical protein
MYTPKVILSPSRLETYDKCSQIYYAKYLEKVPDRSNAGASRGNAVHNIFEILLNKPKYLKLVNQIIETQKVPDSLLRLAGIYLRKEGFYSEENVKKCKKYILTGLNCDFYCEGGDLKTSEFHFEIGEEYKIQGYIDKHAIFKDEESGDFYVKIYDYKSKKEKYTELELKTHIQGYGYLLAAKKKYPEINLLLSSVVFILLDYPEDPMQIFKIEKHEQIHGFEEYLKYTQKNLDGFSEKDKNSNLAASLGWVKEGFKGLVVCGRAKSPNELKKNGEKSYYCNYKFSQDYFVLVDNEQKIRYSSYDESELKKIQLQKPDLKLEKRKYDGCGAFKKNNFTFYKDKEDKIDF